MTDNNDPKFRLDGGRGTSPGYATLEEVLTAAKEGGIVIENGEDISDLVPKQESAEVIWARFNASAKNRRPLSKTNIETK